MFSCRDCVHWCTLKYVVCLRIYVCIIRPTITKLKIFLRLGTYKNTTPIGSLVLNYIILFNYIIFCLEFPELLELKLSKYIIFSINFLLDDEDQIKRNIRIPIYIYIQ